MRRGREAGSRAKRCSGRSPTGRRTSLELRLCWSCPPTGLVRRSRPSTEPAWKRFEELQPERSLRHSPVFQTMLLLQNAPRGVLDLDGLTARSVGAGSVVAKFDLQIAFVESGGGLRASLEYNTDLFDAERMERM